MIEHIYDQHHKGVAEVVEFRKAWEQLRGRVPPPAWQEAAKRLEKQESHARQWCRTINTYFV